MKSKKLKIVAGIMVLTMLTTCMMSGTLAKYTTGDSASDSARIAKWGVQVEANGYLFGNSYGSDNQVVAAQTFNTLAVSETARARDNWVAPGTKNDNGFSFSITGEPEVSGNVIATISYENIYLSNGKYGFLKRETEVTRDNFSEYGSLYFLEGGIYKKASSYGDSIDKAFFTIEDYVELTDFYYPIEYRMIGTSNTYNADFSEANNGDSLSKLVATLTSDFETVLSKTQVDCGKTTKTFKRNFNANENLETVLSFDNQNISWKWDLCQSETECQDDSVCDFCKADTILAYLMLGESYNGDVVKSVDGNNYSLAMAAEGEQPNDYNLETQFDINLTVTQTD